MHSQSIDWPYVLGPLASPAGGFSASELLELEAAIFELPQRAVRPRPTLSESELPFQTRVVPWFSAGRFVHSPTVRPGAFLQHVAGDYTIQDAGSMLALAMCDVSPGQLVCDVCASPGGKSTGILERLGGHGVLVSNEVIASRVEILSLALCRSGYGNQIVTNLEVQRLGEAYGSAFDWVLVDAPCTGQSLVARGKQSRAAFSAAQIQHSSARQMRIIRAAADLVRPGGRLVYSTCSFSYAENEGIVQWFLGEHPQWQPVRFSDLTKWESSECAGCYRLWPHRDRCAGAFAATLVRPNSQADRIDPAGSAPLSRPAKDVWKPLVDWPGDADWFDTARIGACYRRGNQIHRFPAELPIGWIESAHGGVPLARERSANRWQPHFGSSLLDCCRPKHTVALSDSDALSYIAGESVRGCPDEGQGWCRVTWRGRVLSWGKLSRGTLKNHFPKALRQPNLICQDPAGSEPPTRTA